MTAARAIQILGELMHKGACAAEVPADCQNHALEIAQLAINAMEEGELFSSMSTTCESEARWERAREAYRKAAR